MGNYIPSTPAQQQKMLDCIGISSLEELYRDVPGELLYKGDSKAQPGKSLLEAQQEMSEAASENKIFCSMFRGAGSYRHYIPPIVESTVSKETFLTAYTPYQAEISQGILQSIFEYQTMICQLTGMDASNASIYDGASAAAEAAAMCRDRKRHKALISSSAHPDVIETIKTYCWAADAEMELIPSRDGVTDLNALEAMLDDTAACVYIQQPNYFGNIEDCQKAAEAAHGKKAKFIMGINPIAAAVLKTPGECGADITVGEGQPLGMSTAYGGPYLGFMAASKAMTRKLPGRIVGETHDGSGNRAFVLTLQAREQHIRREKASSNVCSNQALCAMTAAVYMAAMGARGIREAAVQSMSKARYLAAKLDSLGFSRIHSGEFFHEFVTSCPVDAHKLDDFLCSRGILGGLPIDDGILWCTTELNSKSDIDSLTAAIAEFTKKAVKA